jgi:hypothetical protein
VIRFIVICTSEMDNYDVLNDDLLWLSSLASHIYRVSQEERSIFLEVTVSVILSKKKVYMYMCPNSERFPLYSTPYTVKTSKTPSP